ncbi:MAG: MarR family winged helix-turn-helix transcriptional regulator [Ilumatobacteraceae bacterium]
MSAPRIPVVDLNDPQQRDVAMRVGRAWREIRRGASMSQLIEYLFGVGDDALEIGQMDTLDLLVQQPSWRMGDLADALRVDPSTATRAVQRLERFGLATRCNSPEDKRVVMVSATAAGRHRHADAAAHRQELMHHIMSSFGHGELENLASTLERFIGAIDDFVNSLPDQSTSTNHG